MHLNISLHSSGCTTSFKQDADHTDDVHTALSLSVGLAPAASCGEGLLHTV